MIVDLTINEKVKQLRREGIRPAEHLVRSIVRAGEAAVGPLLALATDIGLMHEDDPECFAPLHALRLLGEVGSVAIIEPLLRELPVELEYDGEELPKLWAEETAQIIGHLGSVAIEPLWRLADDEAWNIPARSAAALALGYVTAIEPGRRDEIIAGLRERLDRAEDMVIASHLVIGLANIGAREAYDDVMARYRAGKLVHAIIPPGAARQLLLSDSSKRLGCATHTLWERYDQHGPVMKDEG